MRRLPSNPGETVTVGVCEDRGCVRRQSQAVTGVLQCQLTGSRSINEGWKGGLDAARKDEGRRRGERRAERGGVLLLTL